MQIHVCMDINTSRSHLFSRVSHMLCWFVISLPSQLRCVSLNAPRRSRPGSRAPVCRWSRYLCRGRTSPSYWPLRAGPLGSTSTLPNWLGCGNVGHKIIITSPQRGPLVNTDTHSHAYRPTQTVSIHEALWQSMRYSGVCGFFLAGEVLYGRCSSSSSSQWSVVKALLAYSDHGYQTQWRRGCRETQIHGPEVIRSGLCDVWLQGFFK